jgi:hypothetical protein
MTRKYIVCDACGRAVDKTLKTTWHREGKSDICPECWAEKHWR